jgi:hypothetical protein
MAHEYQPQTISDPRAVAPHNANSEQLKTIIREQNAAIEALTKRVAALEKT